MIFDPCPVADCTNERAPFTELCSECEDNLDLRWLDTLDTLDRGENT